MTHPLFWNLLELLQPARRCRQQRKNVMGVVTDKNHTMDGLGREDCTFCGDRIASYPHVYWMGGAETVYICNSCCEDLKQPLMADLIQVSAIMELKTLSPVYTRQTFVRRTSTGEDM